MKKIMPLFLCVLSFSAFAGRPTPKGDSFVQFRLVMEQAEMSEFILSVTKNADNHFIMETQKLGETFCRARGYFLKLVSRDPRTAAPTYEIKSDLTKRPCEIAQ
jgi:hypothetical protein